jgi:hypothetical protein
MTDLLAKFADKHGRDDVGAGLSGANTVLPPQIADFLYTYGGASFGKGLYRIIAPNDFATWLGRIKEGFPDYAERVLCFGYDWLGNSFALDGKTSFQSILLFEPGTGEILNIPANLATFHQTTLIDYPDAAVAQPFHQKWLRAGGAAPERHQCVGYKRPLFLGGRDDESNLELSDLDVYWTFAAQMIRQVAGLPPGTRVNIKPEE